jgi:hypothetical protein
VFDARFEGVEIGALQVFAVVHVEQAVSGPAPAEMVALPESALMQAEFLWGHFTFSNGG